MWLGEVRSFKIPVAASRAAMLRRGVRHWVGRHESAFEAFPLRGIPKIHFFHRRRREGSEHLMMEAHSAPKFTGTHHPRSAHTSPVESVGCWIMECFERFFQLPRHPDQRAICLDCPVGTL